MKYNKPKISRKLKKAARQLVIEHRPHYMNSLDWASTNPFEKDVYKFVMNLPTIRVQDGIRVTKWHRKAIRIGNQEQIKFHREMIDKMMRDMASQIAVNEMNRLSEQFDFPKPKIVGDSRDDKFEVSVPSIFKINYPNYPPKIRKKFKENWEASRRGGNIIIRDAETDPDITILERDAMKCLLGENKHIICGVDLAMRGEDITSVNLVKLGTQSNSHSIAIIGSGAVGGTVKELLNEPVAKKYVGEDYVVAPPEDRYMLDNMTLKEIRDYYANRNERRDIHSGETNKPTKE